MSKKKPVDNAGIGARIFDGGNILFMLLLAFIMLYPMYNILDCFHQLRGIYLPR